MGKTLFPILLGAAALSLTVPLPVVAGPEKGRAESIVSLPGDAIAWDAPEYRDYFEFQRWMAGLSKESRFGQDAAPAFETEASWSKLSAAERAERVRKGLAQAKALQESGLGVSGAGAAGSGGADRNVIVKLLGARVDLDSRISAVQKVEQKVRAPDEFKRFVEGSQFLPTDLAFQPNPDAAGPSAASAGTASSALKLSRPGLRPGRIAEEEPVRSSPGDLHPGQAGTPVMPYRRPEGPVVGGGGPDVGFFALAFAATGFIAALGFGLAGRRFSWGSPLPAGGASEAVGSGPGARQVVVARPAAQGGAPSRAPSLFRATPQSGTGTQAGISPLRPPQRQGGSSFPLASSPGSEPVGPGSPVPSGRDDEHAPADWNPPPIPPPAAWPTEGLRPAAWWAISKEEQSLLYRWADSPERADMSFEEWLDRHPELACGVDIGRLKDKLRREPS
ncbi:MAG: hypothetical protein HZB91_02515 [Elusimicrobia bacterium]|nr:hypothetical protein [Elusimicrobiota bacterium]